LGRGIENRKILVLIKKGNLFRERRELTKPVEVLEKEGCASRQNRPRNGFFNPKENWQKADSSWAKRRHFTEEWRSYLEVKNRPTNAVQTEIFQEEKPGTPLLTQAKGRATR